MFAVLRKCGFAGAVHLPSFLVAAAEELLNFAYIGGAGVGREALDEDSSVLFFQDAVVEEHEQSTVVERSDEASEALFEGNHRGGHRVVIKAVPTIVVDSATPGLYDGIAGHSERNLVDDDAA